MHNASSRRGRVVEDATWNRGVMHVLVVVVNWGWPVHCHLRPACQYVCMYVCMNDVCMSCSTFIASLFLDALLSDQLLLQQAQGTGLHGNKDYVCIRRGGCSGHAPRHSGLVAIACLAPP